MIKLTATGLFVFLIDPQKGIKILQKSDNSELNIEEVITSVQTIYQGATVIFMFSGKLLYSKYVDVPGEKRTILKIDQPIGTGGFALISHKIVPAIFLQHMPDDMLITEETVQEAIKNEFEILYILEGELCYKLKEGIIENTAVPPTASPPSPENPNTLH